MNINLYFKENIAPVNHNGKRHGYWVIYLFGIPNWEGRFINGQKDGQFIRCYNNVVTKEYYIT